MKGFPLAWMSLIAGSCSDLLWTISILLWQKVHRQSCKHQSPGESTLTRACKTLKNHDFLFDAPSNAMLFCLNIDVSWGRLFCKVKNQWMFEREFNQHNRVDYLLYLRKKSPHDRQTSIRISLIVRGCIVQIWWWENHLCHYLIYWTVIYSVSRVFTAWIL